MRIEAFIQSRANYYLLIFVILTISSFVFHKSYGDAGWLDFGVEYSVPSIFGYALLLLCALGFYRLMQLDQSFDAWVYAFGYFLADDMLTLHETAGWLLYKYNLLPDIAGFGVPPLKWSTNRDRFIPPIGGPGDGWKARQA